MTTQRIAKIAIFTALTVIGGFIRFPVPLTPVMLTLQVFFVVLSGLVLGSVDGAFSQLCYVLLGLAGLPVFSKAGGIFYVFEPSFGFLLAFPLGAFLTGFLSARFKTLSVIKLFSCCFAGVCLIYIVGAPYQFFIIWLHTGSSLQSAALSLAALPFLLAKDIALLYLVCLFFPKMRTMAGSSAN